jgi:alpha-tubulin suppressor-like RCC1 family protein
MSEVNNRLHAMGRGRRWRGASGAAMAAVATAMLAPSMAMAATGGPGQSGQPAAVTPGGIASWGDAFGLGRANQNKPGLAPGAVSFRTGNVGAGVTVSQLAGGCGDAVAVTSTGEVVTWGNNEAGQGGAGSKSFIAVPAEIATGNVITSVQAGCKFDLALTSSGQVLSWGDNTVGQLGIGTRGGLRTTPVQIRLPRGVQVAAISAGSDFAMALTATGQLYAWGDDLQGQLGDGTFHLLSARPVLVRLPRGVFVVSVSAGGAHTLALTNAGRLLSWGANNHGQLGNGSRLPRRTPFPVLGAGTNVTAISAGGDHSLALTDSGKAMLAWGANNHGQLGIGSFAEKLSPVQVTDLLPLGVTVTALSTGAQYSMALLSNGVLATWGANNVGQLAVNSVADSDIPNPAHLPSIEILGGKPNPITVTGIGAGPATSNGFLISPSLTGS